MKRPLIKLTLLILTCIFGLTNCSSLAIGLYGIKDIKTVDEETILHYSKKYNIPFASNYELDTSYYSFLASFDIAIFKNQINNHFQPLQALYYDKTGQLQSFQINCYAGGFPNLDWDRNEILTTFPPKEQAPLDSLVPLELHLKYLKPLAQTESLVLDSCDYVVIVYWSRFMGRQSKRLIRYVQENSKLEADKKVKIIYANTDNFFTRQ